MVTYAAESPDDYFRMLEDDWRKERIRQLHDFILTKMPGWEATIDYKMLGYGPKGDAQMHMNAQKGFVGLYVGDVERIDPGRRLSGSLNCGKGCVRLRKKDVLDEGLIAFLNMYFDLKRQGAHLGGR